MKKYICNVCEYVYDPANGDPESGIPAGTAFEDIPDDWTCPVCGVGKDDISPVDESSFLLSPPLFSQDIKRWSVQFFNVRTIFLCLKYIRYYLSRL